jgi:hypothetical protein
MKTMNQSDRIKRSGLGRIGTSLAALALVVGMGACDTDDLITLPDPDLITLPTVRDTANIEAVRNGAVFEFARAFGGDTGSNNVPGVVGIGGVLTDEMWYASTFNTMQEIDRRTMFPSNGDIEDVYRWLHRARNLAAEADALYEIARPDAADRSLLLALNGYAYVLFAEHWCSGVPFSKAPLGEPLEFAPGIPRTAALDTAIVRFDEAITRGEAAGNAEFTHLARVGKARALLELGEMSEAAEVAAQVPTDFEFFVTYVDDSAGQNNGLFSNVNQSSRSSMATLEGANGIRFFNRGPTNNEVDPRVEVDSLGFGIGSNPPIAVYRQLKYPSLGGDIPLATGIEARLIEAESALASADATGAFEMLSDLRARVGLDEIAAPTTPDDQVLELYEERALWLWLTAHRVGDLRRLIRAYGFDHTEVFPVGTTIRGTPYGSDVNFPIPEVELNNPEYQGQCMDREA